MSDTHPLDIIPPQVIALIVVPLVVGLLLLGVLFDLGATAWAAILTVVLGGVLLLIAIVGRTVILQKQRGPPEEVDDPEQG